MSTIQDNIDYEQQLIVIINQHIMALQLFSSHFSYILLICNHLQKQNNIHLQFQMLLLFLNQNIEIPLISNFANYTLFSQETFFIILYNLELRQRSWLMIIYHSSNVITYQINGINYCRQTYKLTKGYLNLKQVNQFNCQFQTQLICKVLFIIVFLIKLDMILLLLILIMDSIPIYPGSMQIYTYELTQYFFIKRVFQIIDFYINGV
ncbi:unnamed protein product (macronuclear) [Paramecium tetraurelia]|uniref:Transmembrane protein n=1 Tax=Paramecium tetraurelia TaxID=5888 RepID=A0BC97_PARTE|nr:uncharacterized protein GSPATT00004258001 [Paramecium tetraurelia]CAK56164.1 unnamed protein product [Paramecium tetraurelia]|eukprot:XP_001423562.1 hypothetical protein (macronuclear) [Paramecium tetraurelia strain d4-2]